MSKPVNGFLRTLGLTVALFVIFAGVVAFAVRASDAATRAEDATQGQETRLRAVETSLPAMARDIKAIRDLIERELKTRTTPSKGRSGP